MPTLTLTKHHGWGNDFLVLLDPADRYGEIAAPLARALCARHTGMGADGLIRGVPGRDGADLAMELRNADGGRAEMSGNGIRCLAQAAADAGLLTDKRARIATDAGDRDLVIHPEERPGLRTVEVDMGPAAVGDELEAIAGQFDLLLPQVRARRVSVGNPHLVLMGPDPATIDVATLGSQLEGAHAGGINVEFVTPGPGSEEITLRVWERGVGETQACGTGACAAAAAAHAWGLVGPLVAVRQPGGVARVEVGATIVLVGPAERIGSVEIDWDDAWS